MDGGQVAGGGGGMLVWFALVEMVDCDVEVELVVMGGALDGTTWEEERVGATGNGEVVLLSACVLSGLKSTSWCGSDNKAEHAWKILIRLVLNTSLTSVCLVCLISRLSLK
jgi:hypothetical protein